MKHRIFLKKRLLSPHLVPALLTATALPLTILFFGPLDLFFGNKDEFAFQVTDFLPWCLLAALLCSAILTVFLLALRGKAFYVSWGLLTAIALLLFLQGILLNGDLSSLAGDGTAEAVAPSKILLNILLWLVLLGSALIGALLLPSRFCEGARLAGIIAMVTLIGMQTVTLSLTWIPHLLGGDSSNSSEGEITDQSYLTYRDLNSLSKEGNVVVFVVDRFDTRYMEQTLREEHALLSELDGFTYFDDAISLYPRTYPSVSYLATGVETDFDQPRTEMLNKAYEEAPFLRYLSDNGYAIRLYTDSYTAYDNASSMKAYIANASVATPFVPNKGSLAWDMVRLSLYRYLPLGMKDCVGELSTPDFERHVSFDIEQEEKYSTDMRDAYVYLSEHPLDLTESQKSFSLIHLSGSHLPNAYDRNFDAIDKDHPEYADPMSSMAQSFSIINSYLRQMKDLGLYEDATIVITGDHASIGSDSAFPLRYAHLTALLVKPRGSSTEALIRSSAPVTHEDLFATILTSEGLSAEGFGRSVFDVDETETRERRYLFQRYQKELSGTTHELIEFRIVGKAAEYSNWEVVSRRNLGKSIYD